MNSIRPVNYRALTYLLLAGYVLHFILYLFLGEKIPVNGGYGWDGSLYGKAANDLLIILKEKSITNLHAERLLPSALLYLCFKLLGISPGVDDVILGFEMLNFVTLLLSIVFLIKICRHQGLNDKVTFMITAGLLLTFPLLKFIPYYPVLTDSFALLIGFVTLYGVLTRIDLYLYVALVISTFTWPTAAITIPLLLIFKKEHQLKFTDTIRFNQVAFIIVLICIDLLVFYFLAVANHMNSDYPQFRFRGSASFGIPILVAGILCMNVYMFFGFRYLTRLPLIDNIVSGIRSIRILPLVICAVIIVGAKAFSNSFPKAEFMKVSWYIQDLLAGQGIQPLANLAFLILYFGPVGYILLFNWNNVVQRANSLGIGFILFFTANAIQFLDAESRHLMFFFPFMLFLGFVKSSDRYTNRFVLIFVLVSLFFSRIWYTINTPAFIESITTEQALTNPVHQRYFMHQGVFTAFDYYLIQFMVVILCGFIVYHFMKMKTDSAHKTAF